MSLKIAKKLKFLRVAKATVTSDITNFCMWIALDELYILDPYFIGLSLIALELWAKNLNFWHEVQL